MTYAPGAPAHSVLELRAAMIDVMVRAGRLRVDLPGEPWPASAPDGHGHLYVLAFDDGMVKVGRTSAPARRLAEFRAHAERWGRTICHGWLSRPVYDSAQAEHTSRSRIRFAGARLRSGSEYFDGVAFEDAVSLVEGAIDTVEANP